MPRQSIFNKLSHLAQTMVRKARGRDTLELDFLEAAEYCNMKEVVACLEAGVNPNCLNVDGFSALHIAAERNDMILALVLLACKNTVIDNISLHGYTPLYIACRLGQPRILRLLLKHGANPNCRDRFGKTPLHLAATFKSIAMAQILFKYNASVNVLDNMNISPLYISIVEQCFMPMTRLLLRRGANPCFSIGNTPLFLECVTACHTPESMECTLLLLDYGEDVNVLDKIARRNALHFVAISEYIPLAVALFNKGCNPFAEDFMKNTPLDVAFYHENYLVAFYLQGFMYKVQELECAQEDEDDVVVEPQPTTSANETRRKRVSFLEGLYGPRASIVTWEYDSESESIDERRRRSTLASMKSRRQSSAGNSSSK